MIRRLQLVAAVGLAKLADWAERNGDRCARAGLNRDRNACVGYGDVFWDGRQLSEVGITQALRDTEET